jgi:hypothetical protein
MNTKTIPPDTEHFSLGNIMEVDLYNNAVDMM